MDEFLERLWKSLALMFGGMCLIYVLIATSRERPTGLSFVIYKSMNQLFSWLLWLAGIGVVLCILVAVYSSWTNARAKEKEKIIEEEKSKEQKRLAEAQRLKEIERKRIKEEEEARIKRKAKVKEQQRQIEKDRFLKTRSAKEANDAALKDFL